MTHDDQQDLRIRLDGLIREYAAASQLPEARAKLEDILGRVSATDTATDDVRTLQQEIDALRVDLAHAEDAYAELDRTALSFKADAAAQRAEIDRLTQELEAVKAAPQPPAAADTPSN